MSSPRRRGSSNHGIRRGNADFYPPGVLDPRLRGDDSRRQERGQAPRTQDPGRTIEVPSPAPDARPQDKTERRNLWSTRPNRHRPSRHRRAPCTTGPTASAGRRKYVVLPLLALVVSGLLFSIFLLALGKSPVEFFQLVWRGGFGTSFSWQNTLVRAAPLILTALCVAIPAQPRARHHRRRGGAGAGRVLGRGNRHSDGAVGAVSGCWRRPWRRWQ